MSNEEREAYEGELEALSRRLVRKEQENAALREALENISKHCELMSRGDMYKMTSTWNIANKALEATK